MASALRMNTIRSAVTWTMRVTFIAPPIRRTLYATCAAKRCTRPRAMKARRRSIVPDIAM
ncbi:hypothetical protein D3C76_1529390 [compost metagenome]